MRVADLEAGTALDWAVAKAEGATDFEFDGIVFFFRLNGELKVLSKGWARPMSYCPSTDWKQGGRIIERERINILNFTCFWDAFMSSGPCASRRVNGETPLIAAMRCFVASKIGDQIDIPEELR